MRWETQGWRKLYRETTPEWDMVSHHARGTFCLLIQKAPNTGVFKLGKHGIRALAQLLGANESDLLKEVVELSEEGCISFDGDTLTIRNLVAAQEARATSTERSRRFRENIANATQGDAMQRKGTRGDEEKRIEEIRTEQNIVIGTPAPDALPAASLKPKKAISEKLCTSCPDPDGDEAKLKEWAEANNVPAQDQQFRAFVDYHYAKGNRHKSWAAAWRTWQRNGKRFASNVTSIRGRQVQKPSAHGAVWEAADGTHDDWGQGL